MRYCNRISVVCRVIDHDAPPIVVYFFNQNHLHYVMRGQVLVSVASYGFVDIFPEVNLISKGGTVILEELGHTHAGHVTDFRSAQENMMDLVPVYS